MGKFINIFATVLAACLLNCSAAENSKEIYTMDINERGSRFTESIEVNNEQETVVYNVPAHNNASESRVLVNYKEKISVTLLPKLKECYIRKQLSDKNEPSLSETRKSMQMRQIVAEHNVTIPVETETDVMIKIREIQPGKLSPKVLKFCAGNRVYLVKDVPLEQVFAQSKTKEGSRLQKRRTYRFPVSELSYIEARQSIKSLQTGVYTCNEMSTYKDVIATCGNDRSKEMKYVCGPRFGLTTCRYLATCKPIFKSDSPGYSPHNSRAGILHVEIECKENHKFTIYWCCEIICV